MYTFCLNNAEIGFEGPWSHPVDLREIRNGVHGEWRDCCRAIEIDPSQFVVLEMEQHVLFSCSIHAWSNCFQQESLT